jgi:hypothetical protein
MDRATKAFNEFQSKIKTQWKSADLIAIIQRAIDDETAELRKQLAEETKRGDDNFDNYKKLETNVERLVQASFGVEMKEEYDIRGGQRGKYAERYAAGVEVKALPNTRSVQLLLAQLLATLKELVRIFNEAEPGPRAQLRKLVDAVRLEIETSVEKL